MMDTPPEVPLGPSTNTPQPNPRPPEPWLGRNSNAIIAVFTAVLAFFAYLQWQTSDTTLKLGTRAWVNLFAMQAPLVKGTPVALGFRLINDGKTPAQEFDAKFRVQSYSVDALPEFTYPNGLISDYGFGVLSPGANPPIYQITMKEKSGSGAFVDYIVDDNFLGQYNNGQIYIVMHGVVNYKDIFGDSHTDRYCRTLVSREKNPALNFPGEKACVDYNRIGR